MKTIYDLKPYEKNAKIHDQAQIIKIAKSIQAFGFLQPVIVDADGVIIVGHGRVEAAKFLGITDIKKTAIAKKGDNFVPYQIVDDLTPDEVKAYRLADNKLNESGWDIQLVKAEFESLNIEVAELTGFIISDFTEADFSDKNKEISSDGLDDLRTLSFKFNNHQYMKALDWLAELKKTNDVDTNEAALLTLFYLT